MQMTYITEHDSYNIPDGAVVVAYYCEKKVIGIVTDSRCKYGTRKQYSIKLLEPVSFPWCGSDRKAGDTLLVDNTDMVEIVG